MRCQTTRKSVAVSSGASPADSSSLATALAMQPLPTGNRLAVITNAGGPGIMAADAAELAVFGDIVAYDPATMRPV